jgi:signal transduction histidine kinase/ligand-binding sensor domain-containing protein/DNA-binding NarL/FixJ family response regulator
LISNSFKMRLIITILVISLALFPIAESANHHNKILFSEITFEMGLPFNKCNSIVQDQKGFIWIGSDLGLHRYDGNDFISFFHNKEDDNTIREGKVNSVFIDSKSNFWVATASGVDRYLEDENLFIHVPMEYEPMGISNEAVIGFYENDKKELFLHCHFSFYKYNPDLLKFERVVTNIREIDQASYVFESLIEYNGNYLVATSSRGLVLFNTDNNIFKCFSSKYLGSLTVNKAFKSSNGKLWLATDNGVMMVEHIDQLIDDKEPDFIEIKITRGEKINALAEDQNGYIWASSDGRGIFRIDPESLSVINYLHNGESGDILSNKTSLLYVDFQNNLWAFFGNYGFNVANLNYRGIFKTVTSSTKKTNRLSGDVVTSFVQNDQGHIWIGTDGDGLNYFDPANSSFKHFFVDPSNPNSISSNVILSLYIDTEKKLWIGTYQGGLNRYDPVNGKFDSFTYNEDYNSSISGNDVTSILEDDYGNLLVLTNSNGLNVYDKKKGIFSTINADIQDKTKLSHNGGTTLYKDHAGNIWIGTYYGLNRMDAKTRDITKYFHDPNNPESISSFAIDCIFEDSQNRIWVGTPKGLNMLENNNGKFRRFSIKEGLSDNQINSLIEDEYGFLWIGTNKGLSKLDLNTFQIINYGENHNLPGYIMISRAAMKSRDGLLYFGGNRGFTKFDPGQSNVIIEQPPLYFTDFKIFDMSVKPNQMINGRVILTSDISNTNSITIQSIHRSFSLTFSSLDYAKILKPDFYYMLEGFDNEWRKITHPSRTLNYTNLNPGKYRLIVKSRLYDEEATENRVEMSITILPPWWQTWWANLSYVILIVGIVWMIAAVSLNRLKLKHNILIEKSQKEREIEIGKIKDNFYTGITHEFRTPLTLVLGPLESIMEKYQQDDYLNNQIKLIKKNTTRLLVLINEMLDFKKLEAKAMHLKVDEYNFSEFLVQIAQNFKSYSDSRSINFSIDVPQQNVMLWFDRNKLEKVFYNLLSNAFKYTPDNGSITCRLQVQKDGFVSVTIFDSGIGIPETEMENVFKKYYSALNAMGYQSTGLGLYLTKEIIELHKGEINARNNEDAGAAFEVILKPGNSHFEGMSSAGSELSATGIDDFSMVSGFHASNNNNDHFGEFDPENPDTDKPIVLIAEDNDDVRFFIKSELISLYIVLEARDGAEGLEIARTKIPDLIITDIMMPQMDGRSLCQALKSDELTSHIPIIMLTALSDIENRISGLEMGADSYISKPFHPRHLHVRIKKLLQLRLVLQNKYSNHLEPASIAFTYAPGEVEKLSADEMFFQRLVKTIESNISDSNYQIDDLCNDIGMNYLQLYRKVKAITDMSIKQFILTIKIRNAAKMLESGKFNISEVAYDVGFSSPAYFSETFKKHYSLTPTEYIRKMS